MTETDHKRLLICKQVLEEKITKEKRPFKKIDLRERLAVINTKLRDTIEPEIKSKECCKTNNPFEL